MRPRGADESPFDAKRFPQKDEPRRGTNNIEAYVLSVSVRVRTSDVEFY